MIDKIRVKNRNNINLFNKYNKMKQEETISVLVWSSSRTIKNWRTYGGKLKDRVATALYNLQQINTKLNW